MFDPKQWKYANNPTVKQLCDYLLENVPHDATVSIYGEDFVYIHVEDDGSLVQLDNNSLDDMPEYQDAVEPEEIKLVKPAISEL